MTTLRSVCVFCGSRPGARPAYAQAARETGTMLATEGWRLVYGAGDVGLMGDTARAAMAAGGKTMGVIPTHLMPHEKGKRDLTQLVITEDMHERKKVMFMNSDAIVVLPGGGGTLDEFFEVVTWAMIGLHRKPIFLLNTENYWEPLMALCRHVVTEDFASSSLLAQFRPMAQVEDLRAALREVLA